MAYHSVRRPGKYGEPGLKVTARRDGFDKYGQTTDRRGRHQREAFRFASRPFDVGLHVVVVHQVVEGRV